MKSDLNFINEAWQQYPSLLAKLNETVTAERGFAVFRELANTYAPSLTVNYTRAPIVRSLLAETDLGPHLTLHNNYQNSGSLALELGQNPKKPIWCLAHLDFISFLTGEWQNGRYSLISFCEPRQTVGARDAVAHIYDSQKGILVEAARGQLIMDPEGQFWFETTDHSLPLLTRISYATEAQVDWKTRQVYGAIDDAYGCAALILAAEALSHYPVEALFALTDEEEGVVDAGNQSFSRGSARLFRRTPPERLPDLVIVSDVHAATDKNTGQPTSQLVGGRGAVFTGVASQARGAVTPPHLLSFQRLLAQDLAGKGISLVEEVGYVSRSDCVSAMMVTPNVLRVGFTGVYSHFAQTPQAHIDDLVHLAKTIAAWVVIAQNEEWQSRYTGA
jgi:hypothetical protein